MCSEQMWIAQEGMCFYCRFPMRAPNENRPTGKTQPDAATRDHLFPVSRYPHKTYAQVWACRTCNEEKGDRDPTLGELCRFKLLLTKARSVQSAIHKLRTNIPKLTENGSHA